MFWTIFFICGWALERFAYWNSKQEWNKRERIQITPANDDYKLLLNSKFQQSLRYTKRFKEKAVGIFTSKPEKELSLGWDR